ncbi:MAG: RNA polymerase sporulation sigma factor SigH [Acidimicrobiales bacterium]
MAAVLDRRPIAGLDDEGLCERAKGGDGQAMEALIGRYRRVARGKAKSYFLLGADADDIEQEALIGLFKAVRDYRSDRESSFRAFAELCITRQVISAIKTASRHKHQMLSSCVSMSVAVGSDGGEVRSMEEMLSGPAAGDPADDVIAMEHGAFLRERIAGSLSGLEIEVLRLYVQGRSYQEIGEELGRHAKAVDNALQRIKRKLDGPSGGEGAYAA